MAQPKVNATRQSGPEGKDAPKKGTLHDLPPGGPIMPKKQGYENPGPTKNLRGVEPNTAMHRGTPNPEQESQIGHIGGQGHNPGLDKGNHHGHGVPTPVVGNAAAKQHHGAPIDVKHGVAPGHFARHEGEVDGG